MSGRSLCEESKVSISPLLITGGDQPTDAHEVQYEGKVLVKGDAFGTGSIVVAKLYTAVLCLFEVKWSQTDFDRIQVRRQNRFRLSEAQVQHRGCVKLQVLPQVLLHRIIVFYQLQGV